MHLLTRFFRSAIPGVFAAACILCPSPAEGADLAVPRGVPAVSDVIRPSVPDHQKYQADLPASITETKPVFAFQIYKESLYTYSFPGSNYLMLNFHTTKKFDPASLNPSSISVNLKYFKDGELKGQELMSGKFVKANSDDPPTSPSNILRWKSDQTSWASTCSGGYSSYCQIDVSIYDTLLSDDGEKLDGDGNGTPGGHYRHKFMRGQPMP